MTTDKAIPIMELLGLLIAAPLAGDCVAHQSRVFTYLPVLFSGAASLALNILTKHDRNHVHPHVLVLGGQPIEVRSRTQMLLALKSQRG